MSNKVKFAWIKGPVRKGEHVMRPPVPGRTGAACFYNPDGDDFCVEAPLIMWTDGRLLENAIVMGATKAAAEKAFTEARAAVKADADKLDASAKFARANEAERAKILAAKKDK